MPPTGEGPGGGGGYGRIQVALLSVSLIHFWDPLWLLSVIRPNIYTAAATIRRSDCRYYLLAESTGKMVLYNHTGPAACPGEFLSGSTLNSKMHSQDDNARPQYVFRHGHL